MTNATSRSYTPSSAPSADASDSTYQTTPKRATRQDVARLAGVSTATVSYVLNGSDQKISEETAQRVHEAARMLHYQPSAFAKALRKGTSTTLGVLVPDLTNTFFAQLTEHIERIARERGYATLLMNFDTTNQQNPGDMERQLTHQLLDRDVDAVIVSSGRSDEELIKTRSQRGRIVLLDHDRTVPFYRSISTDLAAAVELATNHLLDHHRQHILYLFGGEPLPEETRIIGWNRAFRQRGLDIGPIACSNFTREGGYAATIEAFRTDHTPHPDAILAGSDLEAIGCVRALHELGLRIPEDVAVISFDDTIDAAFTWPGLTSIHQDLEAIAQGAVNAALNDEIEQHQRLMPTLTIRDSCGCK